MPIWVTVLVALTTLRANIAIQFYFKFVPDVEEQKHHLRSLGAWIKTTAFWPLDILFWGSQRWTSTLNQCIKGPSPFHS